MAGVELPISIHAPRVGGDGFRSTRQKIGWVFQSTPPVWGATPLPTALGLDVPNFNPRPPCGGRLLQVLQELGQQDISIHAPRVGGDGGGVPLYYWCENFNPRPPCGGRRYLPAIMFTGSRISIHAPRVGGDSIIISHHCALAISIHAPRVGGDFSNSGRISRGTHFNPRPPCGGRLTDTPFSSHNNLFQSTPPVWGATNPFMTSRCTFSISIHAPRVGGDLAHWDLQGKHYYFNPRPPCGGRRWTD